MANGGDVVEMVLSRDRLANAALLTQLEKWRNLLDMYEQGMPENLKRKVDERGRIDQADQTISNVSSSIMYEAVENQTPRLLALWNSEGWFNLVPRRGTPYQNAYSLTERMSRQFDDMNFYETIYPATKQAVKIGSATLKVGWDIDFGIEYQRQLVMTPAGTPMEQFVPTPGIVYNAPVVDLVSYFNFKPDPSRRTIKECEYVIEEGIVDKEWLEKQADLGIYYDRDAVKKLLDDSAYRWQGKAMRDPRTMNDIQPISYDAWRNAFRVLSYVEDRRFVALAIPYGYSPSQGIVLNPNNQDNPFDHNEKPYVQLAINVHELNFFAPGILESLRDDQAIDSTLLNMMMDAAIKEIRPQTVIATGVDGLDINLKDLEGYIPGRIIPLKNMPLSGRPIRDLFYEQKPEAQGLAMILPQIRAQMRGESQRKSGQTDYTTGNAAVGSNKTKGGVQILTENANIRNSTSTLVMGLGATRLLNMCISLNHQFGQPSDPIYGDFNTKVFQDALGDNAQRLQALQYILPLLIQMQGNVPEALKRILQMAGETGIELLLPNDGSMQQGMDALKSQQLQQLILMQGMQNAG